MMTNDVLYFLCFLIALGMSLTLTPFMRIVAIRWGILDHPINSVKTHKQPTPYLGGVAVAISLLIALLFARMDTKFPSGTLRSLRGLFYGASIILLLGLVDDVTPKGLGYR